MAIKKWIDKRWGLFVNGKLEQLYGVVDGGWRRCMADADHYNRQEEVYALTIPLAYRWRGVNHYEAKPI